MTSINQNDESQRYNNGDYLKENPTWHAEDSPWKAEQILKIIKRNNLTPKKICEIGCGAGVILKELQNKLNTDCTYTGYEISTQAYNLAITNENNNLKYILKDFLNETDVYFDIIMLIDIIEHLEDYFTYLRSIKDKSDYKILHIPLDFNLISVLYPKIIINGRKKIGHIHYFTKDIVCDMLRELGYEIVDYFYTPAYTQTHGKKVSIYGWIIRIMRYLLSKFDNDLSIRIFGGWSLMILVK